jgi:hypothetical protein
MHSNLGIACVSNDSQKSLQARSADLHAFGLRTRDKRITTLLVVFLVLSMMDLAATLGVCRGDNIAEVNPLAAALLSHGNLLGVGLLKLVSVSVFGAIVLVLRRHAVAEWLSWGAVAVVGIAVSLWGMEGVCFLREFALSRH